MRPFAMPLLLLSTMFLNAGDAADDMGPPDRVEEDWEVVLSTPDPDITCPQILTSMKMDPADEAPIFVFTLNYRDAPEFAAGGLQVKLMQGDQPQTFANQGTAQFQTSGERIAWSQSLALSGGSLTYKVTAGQSTTWGSFGANDSDLSLTSSTGVTTTAGYDPAFSVANSGPSYGSNRVSSMTLLQVRYYRGKTLVSTDSTARPVATTN